MKSPFVRFTRFIRTPLLIATVGLCTLWGCRHVPGLRHSRDELQECESDVASDRDETRHLFGYEEPSLANPISPDASEAPLVSLSDGDVLQLAPREMPEAVPPKTEVTNQPAPESVTADEPMPVAQSPIVENRTDRDTAASTDVEPNARPRQLPETTLTIPRRTTPIPTPKEFEDELFPDLPEAPPKLEVPPEPVREQEAVPTNENEILSLDSYCDALVFDAQGFGYVSHRQRIVKFSPTGETSVWTTLGKPKGHRIEPEGTHLVCDTERREVVRLSFEGKVVGVAAKTCDGVALRAPYDLAVDPHGGFYFTDPGYVQIKNPIGKLHYVDRTGQVSVVVAKLGFPTGIVFDPVRQRVLIAESHFNRIVAFQISEPGRIESHEVHVQLPKSPDNEYHLASLCLDSEGNLYVTQAESKMIHVFDPQGRPLGRFSTGTVAPSSIALRSADATELFFSGQVEGPPRNGKVMRLNLGK